MECLKLLKSSLTRHNNNRNIGQDGGEMPAPDRHPWK